MQQQVDILQSQFNTKFTVQNDNSADVLRAQISGKLWVKFQLFFSCRCAWLELPALRVPSHSNYRKNLSTM